MKYKLILNGCSDSLTARAKELHKFVIDNLNGIQPEATIVIHDKKADRKWLTDNTFSDHIILLGVDEYHPETVLNALPDYCRGVDLLLFPGDYFGEEVSVRLACRLGGGSLVSVSGLKIEDGRIYCCKKVYSQQLQASFEVTDSPTSLAIVRGGGEEAFTLQNEVRMLEADHFNAKPEFIISSHLRKKEKTDELTNARRLIVAGKGVGSREEVERLEEFSKNIDAGLGVSRPVVMNAWAPINTLIGVSGAMAKPELCLTFGVSGAAALYAGIEKSKFIVSVNRDRKAAIIRQSDVAIIDDCVAVLEELRKIVTKDQ